MTKTYAKHLPLYLAAGVFFGIALTKSQVISWYRIQEMFRFDSFHMYGIIGSAVVVGILSVALLKKLGLRTMDDEPIAIPPKEMGSGTRYWLGGTLFGLGWGLTGACPGPIFALFGGGVTVILVVFLGALVGTWAYAVLRPHLPH